MATAGSAALLQGLNSPHGQYGGAPSVASAGGGANKKQYFYLSDLNKPVQIKIKSVSGSLTELAERMLFEQQQGQCAKCGGAVFTAIPLHTELELYVSVSIWSRGAPIGLPANTAYRAAQSPYSPAAVSSVAPATSPSGSGSISSSGGSVSGSASASAPGLIAGPSICNVKWNSWLQFPVQYRDLDHASHFGITVWCVAHGTAVHTDRKDLQQQPQQPLRSDSGAPPSDDGGADSTPLSPLPAHRCSCVAKSTFSSQLGVHSRLFAVGGCSLPIFNKRGLLKLGRRNLHLQSGVEGDPSMFASGSTGGGGIDGASRNPHKQTREQQSQESLEKLEKLLRQYDANEPAPISWLDKLAMRRIQKIQQTIDCEPTVPSSTRSMSLSVEFPAFHHPIVYHQKTYNPPLAPILSEAEHKDRIFVLHDPEIFKMNPIESAYHKMARSNKGLSRDLKPSKKEREEIAAIISSPNKRLSVEAKELLWKFRFSLTDDQRAVTKFLRCVNWNDVTESKQALELLDEWGPITLADALELLSSAFTHEGVRAYAVKQLHTADLEEIGNYLLQLVQALRYEQTVPSFLSDYLITRACESMSLTNFFHWYLCVEVHDAKKGSMYALVLKGFMEQLGRQDKATGNGWVEMLEQQGRLIQQLIALGDAAKVNKGRVDKKVERMRLLLQPDGDFKALRHFQQPIRMAVRPELQVTGILGDESTMFKSALAPLLVCFTTPTPEKYRVIFKSGDDLRQDCLVLNMINLMDTLLKKVKLDLQLTPYRVLATGPAHGFVEFVPKSHTLTSILDKFDKDNPIRRFFEQHNQKPQTLAKVLDTFVKSCAGYSVITYLLGIGDRHLDNVMLTEDGHCLENGTRVALASGGAKACETVVAGDKLVGADGEPVVVQEVQASMVRPFVWRVNHADGTPAYSVSDEHRLTLVCLRNPTIVLARAPTADGVRAMQVRYLSPAGKWTSLGFDWMCEVTDAPAAAAAAAGDAKEEDESEEAFSSVELAQLSQPDNDDSAARSSQPLASPPPLAAQQCHRGTRAELVAQMKSLFLSRPRSEYLLRGDLFEMTPAALLAEAENLRLHRDDPHAAAVRLPRSAPSPKEGVSDGELGAVRLSSPPVTKVDGATLVTNIVIAADDDAGRRYTLESGVITHNCFHIDFSFIFGRDPKPFPPPMKFSKEMVEAMGGADSAQYQDFRRYSCLTFNILRQHANLILNLLSLMGDANIPDLSADVEKNLLKTQEKFRLDLSDTEADSYILALIDQSVSALFPQVMEKIHRWALYWK